MASLAERGTCEDNQKKYFVVLTRDCLLFRVVEIKGKEMAEKAIDKFDRFDMKGRKIVVREVTVSTDSSIVCLDLS